MENLNFISVPADEWQQTKEKVDKILWIVQSLQSSQNKKFLTIRETADFLKCNTSTIHRKIISGQIKTKERTKPKEKILIPAEQFI